MVTRFRRLYWPLLVTVLVFIAFISFSCDTSTNPVPLTQNNPPDDDPPPGGDPLPPDGWYMINPFPTPNNLLGVHVLNSNTATAVGEYGTIIRTDDGGRTWVLQDGGTNADLRGVHYVDAVSGWVVGDDSTILHTTDGGREWVGQAGDIGPDYFDIDFGDALSGTIVGTGGAILGTSDGGATWSHQYCGMSCALRGVDRTGPLTGVVVGGRALWTDDAGETWTAGTFPPDGAGLRSVAFENVDHGIAVGWGSYPPPPPKPPVVETTDGGRTWVSVSTFETDVQYGLHDVAFSDQGYGFIVGSEGSIISTETRNIFEYIDTEPHSVSYADGLWIVIGPRASVFSRGHSGSFERTGTLTASLLQSVAFADTNLGYIVGEDGAILRTTNRGKTWSVQDLGLTTHLFDVCFVNQSTGYIAAGTAGVLRTSDGGATWEGKTLGPSGIRAVAFWDENLGLALGSSGEILRTLDGGDSWEMRADITGCWYNGVSFADASTAVAVCWSDKMIRTADGGDTWGEVEINYSYVNDIAFVNSSVGIAVGRDSDTRDVDPIMRTTDGGLTWVGIESGVSESFYGIHMFDSLYGFIGASNGAILCTVDGGLTWTVQQTPAQTPLYAFFFLDHETGIAVGYDGIILRTATAGEAD
jgi:photosystem II stability/assembly factor-like uncharacterized protein